MSSELPYVTLAILCKNKAHVLPLYLHCIYNLDYPRKKIHLYIRTNDNTDETCTILEQWMTRVKSEYNDIYYDKTNINSELKEYKAHEWNELRFNVLGNIRNESIKYAIKNNTDYFVIDCDNFVSKDTLKELQALNLPVVAPFLKDIGGPSGTHPLYGNYHTKTDENGYFQEDPEYYEIFHMNKKGVWPVNVAHCTYYIKNQYLTKCNYVDTSKRHEYVIFSEGLRKQNVQQYIDNRRLYGYLTFRDTESDFQKELTKEHLKLILEI